MPRHLSNGFDRMQRLRVTAPNEVSPKTDRQASPIAGQSLEKPVSSVTEEKKAPVAAEEAVFSASAGSVEAPARKTGSGKSRTQLGGGVVRRAKAVPAAASGSVEVPAEEIKPVEMPETVPAEAVEAVETVEAVEAVETVETVESAAAESVEDEKPEAAASVPETSDPEKAPGAEPQAAETDLPERVSRGSGRSRSELGGRAVRRRTAMKEEPDGEPKPVEEPAVEAEEAPVVGQTAEVAEPCEDTDETTAAEEFDSAEYEELEDEDESADDEVRAPEWLEHLKGAVAGFGSRVAARIHSPKADTEEISGGEERVFEEVPAKPDDWDLARDESGEYQESSAVTTDTIHVEPKTGAEGEISDTEDRPAALDTPAAEPEDVDGLTRPYRMPAAAEPEDVDGLTRSYRMPAEDGSEEAEGTEEAEAAAEPEPETLSRKERRRKSGKGSMLRNILITVGAVLLLLMGLYMCKVAQDRQGIMGEEEKPGAVEEAAVTSEEIETAGETSETTEEGTETGEETAEGTGEETVETEARSLMGDWLSQPDEETYAEVLRISDGEIAVFSTMVQSEDSLTGWLTGEWYTAEVGKGVPTMEGNILMFTLQDEDETLVYRYEIAWITDDCFMAQVYCNNEAVALYTFDRVVQ